MDEKTRVNLVQQGIKAFEALREWFDKGQPPSAEHLKSLRDMGVIGAEGLTAEGRKMLVGILTPSEELPPGLTILSSDSDGNYSKADPKRDFGEQPSERMPSSERIREFEAKVRKILAEQQPSVAGCPHCNGNGLVLTKSGLQPCENCAGSGSL